VELGGAIPGSGEQVPLKRAGHAGIVDIGGYRRPPWPALRVPPQARQGMRPSVHRGWGEAFVVAELAVDVPVAFAGGAVFGAGGVAAEAEYVVPGAEAAGAGGRVAGQVGLPPAGAPPGGSSTCFGARRSQGPACVVQPARWFSPMAGSPPAEVLDERGRAPAFSRSQRIRPLLSRHRRATVRRPVGVRHGVMPARADL
jgi:hypothetical protein